MTRTTAEQRALRRWEVDEYIYQCKRDGESYSGGVAFDANLLADFEDLEKENQKLKKAIQHFLNQGKLITEPGSPSGLLFDLMTDVNDLEAVLEVAQDENNG